MLVSAISNNRFSAANNCLSEKTVSKNKENTVDTTFNSLTSTNKTSEKDLMAIYDAINRWKIFCHSQIEAGKFDIIA
jgi:hypothetical protein